MHLLFCNDNPKGTFLQFKMLKEATIGIDVPHPGPDK